MCWEKCKCKTCGKVMSAEEFEDSSRHKCLRDLQKLSREELLERLYASGGCSKEYYETEKSKMNKEIK